MSPDHSNIDEANRHIAQIESELDEANRDHQSESQRAERLETELREAKERITALTNIVETMKGDVDWSLNTIEDIRTRLSSASNEARRA